MAPLAALLAALLLAPAAAQSRIEIRSDPRLGLVEALHLLARPRERTVMIARQGSAFEREWTDGLARIKGEPAVGAYRDAVEAGVGVPDILAAVLTGLAPDGSASAGAPAAGVDPRLRRLLDELPGFAKAADFSAFARAQSERSEPWIKAVEARLEARDPNTLFHDYTGLYINEKIVIYLCPFFRRFSSVKACGPQGCEILTFWGPASVRRGVPDFDFQDRGPVLWHEMGHFILDPLSERYGDRIRAMRPPGFEPASCYQSWEQCVREHAAQDLADRMVVWSRRERGLREGEQLRVGALKATGRKVQRRLEDYEKQRDRYPTIADFYPELLEAFAP